MEPCDYDYVKSLASIKIDCKLYKKHILKSNWKSPQILKSSMDR